MLGLMSRWMMPASCAAANASATCRKSVTVPEMVSGPARNLSADLRPRATPSPDRARRRRESMRHVAHDVWMIELRKQECLAQEASRAVLTVRLGQDFDRERSSVLAISGEPDLPIAPAPASRTSSNRSARVSPGCHTAPLLQPHGQGPWQTPSLSCVCAHRYARRGSCASTLATTGNVHPGWAPPEGALPCCGSFSFGTGRSPCGATR